MKRGIRKRIGAAILAFSLLLNPGMAGDVKAAEPVAGDAGNVITNDVFWHDTSGNPIYSQGGGIFRFEADGAAKYYWYGVRYDKADDFYQDPAKKQSDSRPYSVTCYSSADLVNWDFEGDVVTLDEISGTEQMGGEEASWLGRLGVAYMKDTGKYVMAVQHEYADPDNSIDQAGGDSSADGVTKQVLVLTSDSPTGQFKWNQRINMASYTGGTSNTGDQTVFTDEDTGKSYLLYSYGRGRGSIFLSEIEAQEDGKYGFGKAYRIYKGSGREGNCMFQYNGAYYVCASDLYGWNASHAYYLKLDSLEPAYLETQKNNSKMEVMPGCSDDFCHVSQTGFFYTVKGSAQETVLFCGDRWSDFAQNGLGYNQWCPLSFDASGNPYFNSLSTWKLDAGTGAWEAAEDNNYVKNGSFDADRVSATNLAGWKNQVTKGSAPVKNVSNKRSGGKFGLALADSMDFACTVSQAVESSPYVALPDGTYTMTAYVENSGAFENLTMYAKSAGMKKSLSIKDAHESWTEVKLEGIPVSGGKAEVGFEADGAAGAYCHIDDVSFVRESSELQGTGGLSGTITANRAAAGKILEISASREGSAVTYTYEMELTGGEQAYQMASMEAGNYTVRLQAQGCTAEPQEKAAVVEAGKTAENISFAVAFAGEAEKEIIEIAGDKAAQWTAQEKKEKYNLRVHGWKTWETAAYIGFPLPDDFDPDRYSSATLKLYTVSAKNSGTAYLYGADYSAFQNAAQYEGMAEAPAYTAEEFTSFQNPTAKGYSELDITSYIKALPKGTKNAALRIDVKSQNTNNAWVIAPTDSASEKPFLLLEVEGVKVADKTALTELMKEIEGFDTTAYTEDSVREYKKAVDAAIAEAQKTMENEKATQEEVNNAVSMLQGKFEDAKKLLAAKPGEDQQAADKVIQKINEIGTVTLTEASKGKIEAARQAYNALTEEQKKLVSNANVLSEAESLYQKLEEEAKNPGTQEADKKSLNAKIAEAEKKESSKYTKESYQALQSALAAAKAVSADKDATQEQVDRARKTLQASLDGLVAAPSAAKKPGTPSSVKASWTGKKNIKITWKKASNADSYAVYRSYKKTSGYKKAATVKKTSYTDTKATPGKTVYYKVIAYKGKQKGSYSKTTSAYKLAVPSNLKASTKRGRITLTFRRTDQASGYQVTYSTKKNGKYKSLGTIKADRSKSIRKTFKVKKGTYYYKVRAYKLSGKKKIYTDYSKPLKAKVK